MKYLVRIFCLLGLILSIGLLVDAAPTDPVNIPDANLRAVIETKLGKSSGATITEAEMNGMTGQLYAFQKNIRSLTGLEHATGIDSLQLPRNNISDLSPLSGLTQLTSVNLDLNPMTDLSVLKDLVNLTLLYARRPLTQANFNPPTLDLSFLTKLTQLKYLALNVWAIRDLSVLENLTALKELYLQWNRFSDISPLSSLTTLTHLDLTSNYFLTDISPLGSLTALENLHLTHGFAAESRLSDISALKNLTNLKLLWLHSTNITSDGLAEVLPSFSAMDSLILDGTRISDLSVLDHLPSQAPIGHLSLRYIHDPPGATDAKGWLLKDLTPLVELIESEDLRAPMGQQAQIEVRHNWNLDYDSIYTDIPALIKLAPEATVKYSPVVPGLRRRSEEHHVGNPQSRHTFRVSAYSTFSDHRANWPGNRYTAEKVNEEFEGVPVTWKVTAPDGTVTETEEPVRTGDDGLSSFTFTLGNDGETHTIEAIVPENMREATEGPSHDELKVAFTATAVAPPVITLTLDNVGYTHIQWIANVSGTLPQAYVHYYKKSVDTAWIEKGNFGPMPRRFSFILSDLEPGTSYDCQLFALRDGSQVLPGSNVLTARTLSRSGPPPPPPPLNNPPVFRSASAVNVAENTTAVIRIVAEDPDADDAITNYAITGGADQAMLEIGGTGTPSDMLRFKAAPDFENPQDADTDNVCILILTATSGVRDRELTATQTLTITVTDVDESVDPPVDPPVEPPVEEPPVDPPVQPPVDPPVDPPVEPEPPVDPPIEPPVEPSVVGGGAARPPIPMGTQSLIFNEIGNFWDNTNDWIELKNVCNTPFDLSEWQIRLITTENVESGAEIDVVSLPDFVLPAQGLLLVANTDPSENHLASGLDIATGARQHGAQHLYFVAPDLKLPNTPFLLVLQRTASADEDPTIEDVAGNYFWEVLPYGSEVYPFVYPLSEAVALHPQEETAPLTAFGAWQRQHLEYPGYLAAAWIPSRYHAHLGYDRHAPAWECLGTPGYRLDPSPSQPVTHRLVFNEVRNASDDTNDWIELKNVCGTDVQLSDWEISIIASPDKVVDQDIISFPDWTLPMNGVLLITNTDPDETVVAGGLNIATGKRQVGAQHPYFVAPDLELPSTPYLLILRHVLEKDGDFVKTIEDVAGNYFWPLLNYDSKEYPFSDTHPTEPLAPLTELGAWQRQGLAYPGYLAAAWIPSGYHAHLGYDRHAPASMCLGTPGYLRDPSPVLPVVSRVVFNKIRNASDNTNDYIELKNVCDTDVRLRDWEISIVASRGDAADQDVDIASFPDWTMPAQGLLLITNTDPSKTWLSNGLNIAANEQETDARHPYFVAPELKLPDTPFLLILRHAREQNGTPESIEDVAGNYFRNTVNNTVGVWPLADAHRPNAPVAELSWVGAWQRKDIRERGYLATAWTEIQPQYDPIASATLPLVSRVAFNKIRNASDDANDYIELKNVCGTDVRLRDWEISIVASTGKYADQDVDIASFPDYTLSVGKVLLITNTDPDETVMIDGLNITQGAKQQQGARHPYLVAPDLKLPITPYLLILRHARSRNGTPESIEDVAGNYFRSIVDNDNSTEVWPLANTRRPSAPAALLSEEGNWQRTDASEHGYLATAWTVNQSPPGIGSAPNALEDGQNALFALNANAAAVVFNPTLPDEVRITELMSETKGNTLPQWIELYNASQTPVDLKGWQLAVETRTDGTHQHATLTLRSLILPPKQTGLLVTGQGESSDALPTDRVYDLSEEHPDAFSRHLKNTIFGTEGFSLKLLHPTGRVVDRVGNLDGDKDTKNDLPTWTLPDSMTPQGHRFSLLRRFDGDVLKGTKATGWMSTVSVAIGVNAYYGHPTDISTPLFLHQIVPGASPTVALSISEIMFETKTRTRPLPQWIELYNPSFTDSVKLQDYQFVIETRQEGKHQQIVMTLEAFDVLPNQTVLLITGRGEHSKHLPANRTYNLLERHPKAFLSLPNQFRLLSSEGFLIQLSDATGNAVDTIGNLDGYPHTKDTPAWTLPPGETNDGARASLRRLYKKRLPLDGRLATAWVSTADVSPRIITYYGHASDVGNPMYRKGTPLPVTLSSFKAEHTADGVIINWITESELDNAGFNILRSQTKAGKFQQINAKLIQGAGTIGERSTYSWTDTTAKPNTVYYYQIEDVSYAGVHQTLTTTRLRGLISAKGKMIIQWADFKKGR